MSSNISSSLNVDEYEVLIRRRGENEYASYCPQLNLMLTGTFHEEVENKMYEKIQQHIQHLKMAEGQDPTKN
ncbi:MAG: hypothetical protein WC313_02000 [Candidatus Kapaibacterium sp.]|jgi:hypothetical protein|nr:hypothetical protein [Candidatus Kapabacteria bacterium]